MHRLTTKIHQVIGFYINESVSTVADFFKEPIGYSKWGLIGVRPALSSAAGVMYL